MIVQGLDNTGLNKMVKKTYYLDIDRVIGVAYISYKRRLFSLRNTIVIFIVLSI